MRTIRLDIQYDGTDYHGWQTQAEGITIQETIEKALEGITGSKARLTAAGRTDAGVHALGQVAAFRTSTRLDAAVLLRALNAKLPGDLMIIRAADTADGFHPRYDARSKRYFYMIGSERPVSPFLRRFVWAGPGDLDVEGMRACAALLGGRHDFSAFRASGCGARSAIRTIFNLDIEQSGEMEFMTVPLKGRFLKVSIEADAFLRHMVRNIVGTLVEVGRGRMAPSFAEELLGSGDRTLAGPTAPARGLFLECVRY